MGSTEIESFGWPGIKASYTIQRDTGHRYYRGALRRARDKGVIWECHHEHIARGYNDDDGALRCATREHWRRSREARRGAGSGEGGAS